MGSRSIEGLSPPAAPRRATRRRARAEAAAPLPAELEAEEVEQPAAAEERDGLAYFGDVRRYPLLPREEVLRLCREIEALELAAWARLVALPALRPHLQQILVEAESAKRPPPAAAPRDLPARLRAADPERDAQRAVLALLRERPLRYGPPKLVAACIAYVERLEAEAARLRAPVLSSNLRLVIYIAQRYQGRGLPFEDLIQEGNLGLVHGLNRFDPGRGYAFTTYATWWIRHGILRGLQTTAREVRLPVYVEELRRRAAAAGAELEARHGRPATREEIAAEMGLEADDVEHLLATPRTLTLDLPVDARGERPLADVLADDRVADPAEAIDASGVRKGLEQLIADRLTPLEQEVVRLRFGFAARSLTLREVAERHRVSRERIRQIEVQALAKLRRRVPKEWA